MVAVFGMSRLGFNPVMTVLCALGLLLLFSGLAAAQDASSDQAHSYCVKMGYLYRTSPGLNGGQGICEFPDKSWCDAQAFYAGTCGPRLYPRVLPSVYSSPGGVWSGDAAGLCQSRGGTIKSVHTPYGDVLMCVFPDGTTCDLQGLASGRCGDKWFIYAYNWLNAP